MDRLLSCRKSGNGLLDCRHYSDCMKQRYKHPQTKQYQTRRIENEKAVGCHFAGESPKCYEDNKVDINPFADPSMLNIQHPNQYPSAEMDVEALSSEVLEKVLRQVNYIDKDNIITSRLDVCKTDPSTHLPKF